MSESEGRPNFDRPPVEQVRLAVVFRPLTRLRASHLGLFWDLINRDGGFPGVEEYPRREPYVEEFGSAEQQDFRVSVVDRSSVPHVVFSSSDRGSRVAVQDDLLQVSWHRSGEESYPRFERPRAEFVRLLDAFRSFLKDYGLGSVRVRQVELSYVNLFPRGEMWFEPADLQRLVRFAPVTTAFGQDIEDLHFAQRHVLLRDEVPWARMYLTLDADALTKDTRGARLSFTVRGPVTRSDEEVTPFLDRGHDIIVNAFTEVTTEEAHEAWGRRSS
jgi:uncharacterized protein (TIGR04255 family)